MQNPPPRPAPTLEGYRVLRSIGMGGMADIWLIEPNEGGPELALKVLHARGPSLQRRLVLEGQVQARIQHPNVVSVREVLQLENGSPALVMDYARGASLDAVLPRTPLTVPQVDKLVRGILAGVAEAHRQGVVHRDLKPGNILLHVQDDQVVPRVTDFGLAKPLYDTVPHMNTRSGVSLGTPAHMAPEQFRDAKRVDHRADVFSLGTILYEMLTGDAAFETGDFVSTYERVANANYKPVQAKCPKVPIRMLAAIRGALQPDLADRIPSVEKLLEVWTAGTPEPDEASSKLDPVQLRTIGLLSCSHPPVQDDDFRFSTVATEVDISLPKRSSTAPNRPRVSASDPGVRPSGGAKVTKGGMALVAFALLAGSGFAVAAGQIAFPTGNAEARTKVKASLSSQAPSQSPAPETLVGGGTQ